MRKILQILIIENRDLAHAQTFCTRVWHMSLQSSGGFREGALPRSPSFGGKPRPTWLRQTDTPPPPPCPPYLKVWIRHCKEHQRMGVFQFWSCSKEIIFYLVLKNSSKTRGVGTSPQQSFHYLWSTPIKRKNVSEMASVKNLNRRQNSPD